ncbi:MAG TPA: adenosine kinase [Alphaproteobacteria bacterium]|nr:adenosine kinase [Alphaproteobacteria bacterium]
MADEKSAAARFDVAGIGNAIVDVLARTSDAALQHLGLEKGAMTLVDRARAETLYREMGPGIECSGGSVANTIAGIASLGGAPAFIGKVKADALGHVFRHDIESLGVHFPTRAAEHGPSTARCLVFVTEDAQRTMQTYLGACVELGPEDVDEAAIAGAQVTYLEGYLWDPPRAKEAFLKAARVAHEAGRKVALSLSDAFCVNRHREEFLDLVDGHIDILFANEAEITALYQVESFDQALQSVRGHVEIACLTRSAKGSVVVREGTEGASELHVIDAAPVKDLVDSTGAGDLYAAGVLYGLTHGLGLARAGRLGSLCAAEVLSHIGARPEVSLAELAKAHKLV